MTHEIAMVIYPQGSRWLWHITVDGVRQAEDAPHTYATLKTAVAAARQAHIDYTARLAPVADDPLDDFNYAGSRHHY